MPVVSWPIGVPSCIEPMSPTGGLRDNRMSFETDSRMPPIERPLTSWTPEVYQVGLVPLSIEQFEEFQRWYRQDLRYGVHPFAWQHPITGVVSPWKIVKGDPPYQVRKLGLILHGSGRRRIGLTFTVMSWAGNIEPGYLLQEQSDLILQEQSDRILVSDGYVFDG